MYKTEGKTTPICEMKDKLVSWAQEAMMNGKQDINTEEMGKVVDMIKDLAEAEEKCWKACYYKKVIEAMQETPQGRMGYDNWRSADGRFADKGTGTYYGYMPNWGREPWENPPTHEVRMGNMGYTNPTEMAKSIRDMWSTADPKTKSNLRTELNNLVEEME